MDAREIGTTDEAPASVTGEETVEETGIECWSYTLGQHRLYKMSTCFDGSVYVDWQENAEDYDNYKSLQEAHAVICEQITKMVSEAVWCGAGVLPLL